MSNDYIIGRAIQLQTRNGNQGSFGEGAAALNPARNYSVFEFLRIENILTADTARGALPVYDDSVFGDDDDADQPARYKGTTSEMLLALCQDVSRWVCSSTEYPHTARLPATEIYYWREGDRFFGGFDIPDDIAPEEAVSVDIKELASTKYGYADPFSVAHLVGEEVREALTSLGAEDVKSGEFGYGDPVAEQVDPYDGPFYRGRTTDMITLLCHDLADLLKVNGGRYYTPARVAQGSVYYWVAGGRVFGDRELPGWIDPSEAVAVSLAPIADLPAGAVSDAAIARVIAEPIRQAVLRLGGADVYAELLDERRPNNGDDTESLFNPYYQGEAGSLIFNVCDDLEHWIDKGIHSVDEVASWWIHYWVHEDRVVGDYQIPRGVDPSSVLSVSLKPVREIPPQHIDGHWIARAIGQSIREAVMRLGAPDLEPIYLDAIGQERP